MNMTTRALILIQVDFHIGAFDSFESRVPLEEQVKFLRLDVVVYFDKLRNRARTALSLAFFSFVL